MSRVMLPNGWNAIPKTNAERVAAEQPPAGGIGAMEDSPDIPGEEVSKDARVWKTYVRETDRWDKEMIDGRNK
ncbi:hypothetical protein FRC07_013700 [Ceratobasidium sp. 392]|nr:hypothetical protein FRC07_013700 [Ceratobasidium sp. 392]